MPLKVALDVGHSSIGWAVLEAQPTRAVPDLRGCGVVLFEKDSALAFQRRGYRQQRRHVRATRQRIHRLELLLEHVGALTPQDIAARHGPGTGHPAPWQLAARVLASKGARLLTWAELWTVLRWYAHNRGYEPWGERDDADPDAVADTEKEQRAKEAMASLQTTTMCETVCRWLGVDPLGAVLNDHDPAKNLRQQKAAFPRMVVRAEVRQLLDYHRGKLPGITDTFITSLMDNARVLPLPNHRIPTRYRGGLLFGRLQMRYDNRIISRCVHTAAAIYAKLLSSGKSDADARTAAEREAKVPAKKCPEFLRYRWGMLLATMRIATTGETALRPLTRTEREALHQRMVALGRLTKTKLKEAVHSLSGWQRDGLENQFLHPDAERALLLDPVADLIASHPHLKAVWPVLPERLRRHTANRWWRIDAESGLAHAVTLQELRAALPAYSGDVEAFDAALAAASSDQPAKTKATRRPKKSADRVDPLTEPLHIRRHLANLKGRAPYGRKLLEKAFEEVMAGRDPKAKDGCLEETDAIKAYREGRSFDRQTNNHLLRHRLLILGRLLQDLIADPSYGAGDRSRFDGATIEVNRELREHAGLTAQDIAKDLGLRLKPHSDAVKWLESAGLQPTGSLIRKARVALDLDCRCPYTGELFEALHLRDGVVDLDHIIPRSIRPSDSLDSLAVTFPAVNRWKDKRTAWQFIHECGGQQVPGAPHLSIMTPQRFTEFVKSITPRKPRDGESPARFEEYRRMKRRAEFFEMESYTEKERDFTPGQLTQTSQLTRLARIAVRRALPHLADHEIVALPGSVTAAVRKAWQLMDCLATVTPAVLDAEGRRKPKDDIRAITHLHHAVDAIALGYASALLPNRGDLWQLLSLRRIPGTQQEAFRSLAPVEIDSEGRWRLRDLLAYHPNVERRIRECLAERRVIQHIPADVSGIRLEQNTWRVRHIEEDRVHLRQLAPRDANGVRPSPAYKSDEIEAAKAFGLNRGKLHAVQGVRVLAGNFGIAVLSAPMVPEAERIQIIRYNRVWEALRELRRLNAEKPPMLFRSGALIDVPAGSRKGRWRIISIKKSAAFGISFDLSSVDGTKLAKGNAPVETLVRDGVVILRNNYCGSTIA